MLFLSLLTFDILYNLISDLVILRALCHRLIAIYLSLNSLCILFPFAAAAWYFRQQKCKCGDSLSPFHSLPSLGLLDNPPSECFTVLHLEALMVDSSAAFTGIVEFHTRAVFIASFSSCKFRENALDYFVESNDSLPNSLSEAFRRLTKSHRSFQTTKLGYLLLHLSLFCVICSARALKQMFLCLSILALEQFVVFPSTKLPIILGGIPPTLKAETVNVQNVFLKMRQKPTDVLIS
jgi:hypothetical protein